ncbi:MAG: PIG-L deacetylase family protein [Candidatus Thorarchaeota archaeon]
MNAQFFQKVLILSPHTDDGELGAGATIAKLVEQGSDITYFAFSAPRLQLKKECQKSLNVLGITDFKFFDFKARHFPELRQQILEILYRYNKKNTVDLVFTPSTNDLHQDHQTITNETLRSFKSSTILGYELPWNHIEFRENCFVALSEQHIQKKIDALWNYQSQIEQKRIYFDKEYLKSLLRANGLKIGVQYAETFEAIKLVLNEP